jgi:hypothetical protein
MADYRKMYDDKEYLYDYDLEGDRTLEIASVNRGELTGDQNRKTKKPMVSFVGEAKKLALNKTNGKTIAKLYGTDTDDWAGELITLYPTTTAFGGETVGCIRVRPQRPERSESRRAAPAPSADRRSSGNASRQSKTGRDTEASAVAAKYLISQYEKCDGSEGLGEARMAELKLERGHHWPTMLDADRDATIAAAKAAKTRIDTAGAGSPADKGSAPPDADEAAEIARSERQESARG